MQPTKNGSPHLLHDEVGRIHRGPRLLMFTPLGLLPPSQFRSRSPLFMREVARTSHHRRGAFATWKVRPYRGSVISVPPYSHTAAPSTVYFLYGLGPFACSYTCPYRAYTAFFRGLLYALAHALIRGVCVDPGASVCVRSPYFTASENTSGRACKRVIASRSPRLPRMGVIPLKLGL